MVLPCKRNMPMISNKCLSLIVLTEDIQKLYSKVETVKLNTQKTEFKYNMDVKKIHCKMLMKYGYKVYFKADGV